ncbi:MAG: GTP-binding protein [Oscillospiraceae bacterium]|nr:GTP-binding protein [Oscillospiraceae bacterium]
MNFKKFMALICTFSFVFSNFINVSAVNMVKVVFAGNSGVGKTTVFEGLQGNAFNNDTPSTVAASFIAIVDDDNDLRIWDISGAEQYRSLIRMYYRGADIVVIFVDSTNRDNIEENINIWREFIADNGPEGVRYILVATKTDLPGAADNSALIEKKATEHHMELYRVSAKSGAGMEDFKNALARAATEVVAARTATEDGTAGTATTPNTGTQLLTTPLAAVPSETTATPNTVTQLLTTPLAAGIVTGITAAVGLIATMVHLAKSRLSANRPQQSLLA